MDPQGVLMELALSVECNGTGCHIPESSRNSLDTVGAMELAKESILKKCVLFLDVAERWRNKREQIR
jgi:hypothetical protein